MNYIVTGSLVSLTLYGMGFFMLITGIRNFVKNSHYLSDILISILCVLCFFWEFGYAWMGLCHNSDAAYAVRGFALVACGLYMAVYIQYVTIIGHFNIKFSIAYALVYAILFAISLPGLIRGVTFESTPWGNWYVSQMTASRVLETVAIAIASAYIIAVLIIAKRRAATKREKSVFKQMVYFPFVFFAGFAIDTVIPSIYNTAAVPGTCVAIFFATWLTFYAADKNRLLALSKETVSNYVFDDVNIPVIVTDQDDKILLCNHFTSEYLCTSAEAMPESSIADFFVAADDSGFSVKGDDKECILDTTEIKDRYGDKLYNIYFVRDVSEERRTFRLLQKSNEELERLYNRDPLTGLYNRRGFYKECEAALKGKESGYVLVCSLDLDNLKRINDKFGHSAGDFSIMALSEAFLEWNNDRGICARFGGDEFVGIIYSDSEMKEDTDSALKYINSILCNAKEQQKLPYDLVCSVGVWQGEWNKDRNLDDLISRSDRILYEIKKRHHGDAVS